MKTFITAISVLVIMSLAGAVHAENASGAPEGWPEPMMGEMAFGSFMVERLEYGHSDEGETKTWDIQGWYGTDKHKLWLKSEGEGPLNGSLESAEVQLLYSRMVSPFFDLQLGVRHDVKPAPERTFAVLGLQGLAPYRFETDAAFYASEDGDLSFRGELEYEWLFTQKLILQPRLEFTLSADEVPEYGIGTGLVDTEFGLRLRYEIRREFAPYIGVSWTKQYGDTADFSRQAGESRSVTTFVAGVRFWF